MLSFLMLSLHFFYVFSSLIFDLSQEETGDEGGVRPSAEDVRNRKVSIGYSCVKLSTARKKTKSFRTRNAKAVFH